ncbi:MAG: MBL fold metallo-hydrolase [Acidobacteria bacterium]|nr:MBL fold metallo-hydrolase [Acidobacteriota bacterium]
MARIDEIAPDIFRLSVLHPQVGMQFNHFLIRDDEPLLMHAGLRGMFPDLKEAVLSLIEPGQLRWVTGSHFEADEWGGLNDWLALAPNAEPVCGFVGAMVSLYDFAARPPKVLQDGEVLATGSKRFRFVATAHVPHGWDAGVMFEETGETLFTSDLLHQDGDPVALTEDEAVLERSRETLERYQQGPFANYMPYTDQTGAVVERLAALEPKTLAAMHGSSFRGDGAKIMRGVGATLREVLRA